jgi:PKD repeat protein
VQARISQSEGVAPLAIQFSATATDPNGQIMLYEWDFDGDGTYDWSSATLGNTAHTYTHAGDFSPSVRVTDNDGLFSRQFFDLRVDVQASLALTESDRTFNPGASETMGIRTTISGGTEVSVFLKNQDGAVIRTLVSGMERSGGTYTDLWDGRNQAGTLAPSGPYYAMLQYRVGAASQTLDLTGTTGGSQYNPYRQQRYGFVLQPFNNIQLPLTFTIDRPAEITLFMGLLWGADVRLRTLFNREIFGAGTYTVYWDGLTDDGRVPYEHSGDVIPGIWAYNLPDNAVWVAASPPQISSQTTAPALYAPMSEACGPSGEKGGLNLSYTLAGNAASVAMRIYNAETGSLVHEQTWSQVGAGAHTVYWNGRDANNRALDESVYRIGFSSADAQGNRSLWNYNIMRTLYNHQTAEAR